MNGCARTRTVLSCLWFASRPHRVSTCVPGLLHIDCVFLNMPVLWPSSSTPGHIPNSPQRTHTRLSMAALLLKPKSVGRKQKGKGRRDKKAEESKRKKGREGGPKCKSTIEWINKLWYVHAMKYYTAIKQTDSWSNMHKNILLSERTRHRKLWRVFVLFINGPLRSGTISLHL